MILLAHGDDSITEEAEFSGDMSSMPSLTLRENAEAEPERKPETSRIHHSQRTGKGRKPMQECHLMLLFGHYNNVIAH